MEAEKHDIPVLQPLRIREKDEYEKVLALEPDLIVTAAFGQIVPNEILEAPKYGCINVHAFYFLNFVVAHQSIMQLWKGKKNRYYNYVYGRKIGCW